MFATQTPTVQEQQQAVDVVRRYAETNPAKLSPKFAALQEQIEKDKSLAAECKNLSFDLYKQLADVLPDDRSRALLANYSLMVTGQHVLGHAVYTDTKRTHAVYVWAVKKAKKLLGGIVPPEVKG